MSQKSRYMMATKAIHQLGDISRDKPDLCVIYDEDKENYIGNWITGFGFMDVKFPKSTTRELTEAEKEQYNGAQFAIGNNPPFRIWTKEQKAELPQPKNWAGKIIKDLHKDLVQIAQKLEVQTESPVITLPDDETRKRQLRSKLEEYKKRLNSKEHLTPERQMDAFCKTTLLERLLTDGKVKTWDISLEIAKKVGSGFDVQAFNNACGVIEDYCKTGGKNLHGGTGLPSSE